MFILKFLNGNGILKHSYSLEWIKLCFDNHAMKPVVLFWISGPKTDKGGAAALQGGSWDAEGASAPQHRPFLWFLGVCAPGQEMYRAGHWTYDFRDTQDVSSTLCINNVSLVTALCHLCNLTRRLWLKKKSSNCIIDYNAVFPECFIKLTKENINSTWYFVSKKRVNL